MIKQWGYDAGASVWSRVWLPMRITGLVTAGFLFATQRKVLDSSLGLMTAFMAGVPAMLQFFGIFAWRNKPEAGY